MSPPPPQLRTRKLHANKARGRSKSLTPSCACLSPPPPSRLLPASRNDLRAAALIAFCDMLRAADPIQQAFFQGMEAQHAHLNFKWRDMLLDARGRTHAEMINATTAVERTDLSNATATYTCPLAAEEDGRMAATQSEDEQMGATQDEQAGTVIELCRHALNLSKKQLLGTSADDPKQSLDKRVEKSLEACKVDVLQSKTTYPLQYKDKEFQVCCLLLLSPLPAWFASRADGSQHPTCVSQKQARAA